LGVFANALSLAVELRSTTPDKDQQKRPGMAAWLAGCFRHRALNEHRLTMVEKINLAPHQTVTLIEADGQRLLVATSGDGTPSFYPLKDAASGSDLTVANRGRMGNSEGESL
jgi:hypothetical protein